MRLLSTLKIKTLINQKGPQQQPTLLGTLHFLLLNELLVIDFLR